MRYDRYGMGMVSFFGSKHVHPVILWIPEGKEYTYILTALRSSVHELISNHIICTFTC